MRFEELFRERLSSHLAQDDFDCGDPDLNEFLLKDSFLYQQELLGVTYLFRSKITREIIAYFTVLNDGIKASNKLNRKISNQKRHEKIPAVKIGRLAVATKYQGSELGSQILDFIKYWFIFNNKTGCRFLLADAYNNPKTLEFYKKNGFSFLTDDSKSETRAVKFDLKPYALRLGEN